MDEAEIRTKVREIIASSMRVSLDEIELDKPLVELGAESIDFVDMMVGIEHGFNVEFCDEGMLARLEELFGEDVLTKDGELTELGAKVLRQRRPEIAPEKFHAGLEVGRLNELFTPQTWVHGLQEVLAARPSACSQCGSEDLALIKGAKLRCNACGSTMVCPSQGDVLDAWVQRFRETNPES